MENALIDTGASLKAASSAFFSHYIKLITWVLLYKIFCSWGTTEWQSGGRRLLVTRWASDWVSRFFLCWPQTPTLCVVISPHITLIHMNSWNKQPLSDNCCCHSKLWGSSSYNCCPEWKFPPVYGSDAPTALWDCTERVLSCLHANRIKLCKHRTCWTSQQLCLRGCLTRLCAGCLVHGLVDVCDWVAVSYYCVLQGSSEQKQC